MKETFKKYILLIAASCLLIFMIPIIMALLLKLKVFSFAIGTTGAWIAYWGSYLGAIVGAFTVIAVTLIQIRKQGEHNKNQIDAQRESMNEQISSQIRLMEQ